MIDKERGLRKQAGKPKEKGKRGDYTHGWEVLKKQVSQKNPIWWRNLEGLTLIIEK